MNPSYNIIAGLGNPGAQYENTYHNVGFIALEVLRKKLNEKFGTNRTWSAHNKRLFDACTYPDSVTLIRPYTFMNNSGRPVQNALSFFSAPPQHLLVIHDDIDIEVGNIKRSYNRGAGGHNGVSSIINALGTKEFSRLRVGIGSKERTTKAKQKVLKPISEDDRQKIYASLSDAIENVIENT